MVLSPCLGIDLGTTNSLVSIFRNGRIELIHNALGHLLTPSAVSMSEDGTIMVGLPARERMSTDPEYTEVAFKRWMGSERRIRLGTQEFAPEELSALILKSLKSDAEAWLKTPVTRAVITVPAYFNETQRRATKTAAEIAGLQVERLLNEPTAAGLAYGLQEREEHSTFLVFDLGGGTFDVSVLEYFDGIVEVRASAGDTRLGGEDFVDVIENLFLAKYPRLKEKLEKNVAGSKMLWRAAEQAKRDLSDAQIATMSLVIEGDAMECSISREDFESASEELISRLRRPIERALRDARLDPEELAEVVLVGGATRMPLVRQTVARLFQRLPLRTIDPDEAIVRGAAIQAALIDRDAALNEVVLTDVMPYSLGVETTERVNGQLYLDQFSPIIERNLPVPVSRVASYATIADNQKVIIIYVRQGESPRASENLLLGELQIKVPPRPSGEACINVRFSYDINGLLVVDVHELLGDTRYSALIRQNESGMSESEVTAAVQRLEMIKVHPRDQQENAYLIARSKRLYEDLLGDRRKYIQYLLTHFESALDTQDEQKVRRARDSFRQALNDIGNGDFEL